ncbi:hypothetical protein GGQ64_005388 [Rhizobium azooxidifex]|uniref:Uncharacterized protein n=1 Tax=Mycoplana azooxidifex TaxID=1636188 RepID=A0A7W6DF58_9HYPH|nr:hypothetical protein [Mycoplana azooxidifex]
MTTTNTSFRPWHWARMKINPKWPWPVQPGEELPYQAPAGNWIFFWIYVRRTSRVLGTRTFIPMTTLGLDGVE